MLYEGTNRTEKPWWYRWIIEDMQPWFHIAAASAHLARLAQSNLKTKGTRKTTDPLDARMAEIKAFVRLNPEALERHWGEIQRLIFLELVEGKDNLARNLAPILKAWKVAEPKLVEAAADKDRFRKEWNDSPATDREGYSDRACRDLVKFWAEFRDDIPPCCCWSDEAILSYWIADELATRPHTADESRARRKNLEDRRNALNLIKIPCVIVTGWGNGAPVILRKPLPESPDRIATAIGKITPDVFDLAFPGLQAGNRYPIAAKDWLLKLDQRFQRLSKATKEFLADWPK